VDFIIIPRISISSEFGILNPLIEIRLIAARVKNIGRIESSSSSSLTTHLKIYQLINQRDI